jgi:NAD(P)-dependent dehydrogenase (short-subunit alcohol dehydrogenase family)
MSGLAGKTAMVLGGSGAYGAATARMLGLEGANVALGGRDREKLEELEAGIHAAGGAALTVGVHLAKRHHPAHLVQAAVEHFGGLDYLLFAARSPAPGLEDPDTGAWETSVDVNFKGFLYCLAAALPAMGGEGAVLRVDLTDPSSPDPLYEAAGAAARTVLQRLAANPSHPGIRTGVVRLGDPRRADPGACAGAVRRLLLEGRGGPPGFADVTVAGEEPKGRG